MNDIEILRQAVDYFNQRKYVEALNEFEEIWMWLWDGERKQFYKGLIQTAGALHHLVQGTDTSAKRLFRSALRILGEFPQGYEGLDLAGLREALTLLSPSFKSPAGDLSVIPFPTLRFVETGSNEV